MTEKRFHFRFPHTPIYEASPALVQEINQRARFTAAWRRCMRGYDPHAWKTMGVTQVPEIIIDPHPNKVIFLNSSSTIANSFRRSMVEYIVAITKR
ncbi:MAG: hypothetical protein KJ808_03580 [Acidobacteria bacterium]|nr:hypothetical protein [Acidobacteriota bacterium]MBU4404572.1 hypothetical protein [Acidobacteriota bacterium]MCG2809853.1 hypothetical protein [Candidatus Aminicenantes bacterium]